MPILSCARDCDITIPAALTDPCNQASRPGGVKRMVWFACNLDFSTITTGEFWKDGVLGDIPNQIPCGSIRITPELNAEKPESEAIKRKIFSCKPEIVSGYNHKIMFEDYNDHRDETGLYADYLYWNYINERYPNLYFGWFDCNGMFWGPIADISFTASPVIEKDSTGASYWKGEVAWTAKTIDQPIDLSAVIPDNVGFPGQNVLEFLISNITSTCA